MPQSDVETWKKLRADDQQYRWPKIRTSSDYERREYIGPYQLEGNRVWLGKQYCDSEGSTGVGAFGSFDMENAAAPSFFTA